MNIKEAILVLGLDIETPSIADVKKAYRIEQKKWHPDFHFEEPTLSEALENSKKINTAYEILTEQIDEYGSINSAPSWAYRDWKPNHRYQSRSFTPGFPDENVFEVFLKSSNVLSAGYNALEKRLFVKFLSNSVYEYYGVPEYIFEEFLSAESHGRYGNQNIFRSFRYRRCPESNKPYTGPPSKREIG
jgi:hypothetical protein